MPRVKHTAPVPSREKGQRSLDPENTFFLRLVPSWLRPVWYTAEMWRRFVLYQPIAIACREEIISWLISLEWKIEPRDSEQRDELKDEIKYYTKFFENSNNLDFVELLEWLGRDYLDLPFGAGLEIGREGDDPEGRALWIEPLDGGTLFPTLNDQWPVGQSLRENAQNTVFFPSYAINRLYMSPRTEIEKRGWGMPPPEKIYLAMEMLNLGDKYYAKLLLDTPEAGILDFIDMSKESATEWVKAFKELMTGIDPMKVPILYEHTQKAEFIPFGRPPTEILFNQVTLKYATLSAAGYGITLSDIGYPTMGNGGETLAGSIRQERGSRRSGKARAKKKLQYFFDRILPKELKFSWVDPDEELSVALGRARLATTTAFGAAIDKRMITPKEGRLQTIADGLMTISMPEDIPEDEFDILQDTSPFANQPGGFGAKRPGMLGTQVPPSSGGQGEVRNSVFEDEIEAGISRMIGDLEAKSESFTFLPDADSIAQEWVELVAEDRHPEIKERLAEYVKNTVPERFGDTYVKLQEYLEREDMENIQQELSNLRYNLVEDFANKVTEVVEG